jgi:hypothetical protein
MEMRAVQVDDGLAAPLGRPHPFRQEQVLRLDVDPAARAREVEIRTERAVGRDHDALLGSCAREDDGHHLTGGRSRREHDSTVDAA